MTIMTTKNQPDPVAEVPAADTPKLPNIFEALADVMADLTHLAKRDRNQAQGFSFRGIDATINAVGPVLRQNRVLCIPELLEHTFTEVVVGSKRTPMGHAIVKVRYTFIAPDGSYVAAVAPGEAMDSGDKATPKAMSVAMRTALLQTLVLPTDEADPDAATYERAGADSAVQGRPVEDTRPLPSEAERARQALLDWLWQEGLDAKDGVNRWYAEYGDHIKDCEDAVKIQSFHTNWAVERADQLALEEANAGQADDATG